MEEKIKKMEERIGEIEKSLPPIKTFFIPGANKESAWLDYARTVARRCERRVVALVPKDPALTLKYLNRLSDALFVMARYENHQKGLPDIYWNSKA